MARPGTVAVLVVPIVLAAVRWGAAHEPGPAFAPPSGPVGHESAEGVLRGRADPPPLRAAGPCPDGTPLREHRVVALAVEITLNRYHDHDPRGLMYALEDELERIRREEAENRRARAGLSAPAISIGLQGDAIQPLVLRVNQGECLRVHLRNDLDEPVGFELHGVQLFLAAHARVATAGDPAALAPPGGTVTLEWWVAETEPEGTHSVHSHGDAREQTAHGLFGAVIVEPRGSRHLDPVDGSPLASGWSAVIEPAEGEAFREFVFLYHEIGNERYRIRDQEGALVTQIDPYTGAYRPGARALNYRSEPFMNRMRLMQEEGLRFDESLAYSSYAFGDPATPIARSYLGDPVKQRLVHGGSEVFHVHHVHGGATRWPRQPGLEGASRIGVALDKEPPLLTVSERLDAQAVGPSETFDLEHECGSGGCQQGAGDYLVHCHVAHHYFAGMWTIWRVYNTLQAEATRQDDLGPLTELPDRQGGVLAAVSSAELLGRAVAWEELSFTIDREVLGAWVERQLPARGVPRGGDAAVFDWAVEGDLYLGEPQSESEWPGHASVAPGVRLPLPFDPLTGKLAYPWLRPQLGKRPPFAPNHGPAPYLDPITDGHDPPAPGANGGSSVCPAGTELRPLTIHAVSLPVDLNARLGLVDPVGQLYVLQEDLARVRSDPSARVPLVIRANAGEHCVDILFKSELPDTRANRFTSKANLHVHLVQFDVQGSDGLTAGFNFEQSVRPFTVEGERLARDHVAGSTRLELPSASRFHPGALVGIGMEQGETFEVRRVAAVEAWGLVLAEPLEHAHAEGEIVSSEFVRYRWYPDVQFGTAYFHDHVLALSSWRHGLFGALVAEPPGSTYHHPHSGEPIASGPVADIHTSARVSADVDGSFRELVLFVQDDNLVTRGRNTTGGSFNLRVEPLAPRGDAATAFSSRLHGDPETPVLEAVLGDPVVLRSLVAGTNEVHTLAVAGHWFRLEPQDPASRPVNVARIGISERADLVIPRAGGPQALPGDYLIRNGRLSKLREGSWGLLRVFHHGAEGAPRPLPERPAGEWRSPTARGPPAGGAEGVCPASAPVKAFSLVAMELPLPMLGTGLGRAFVAAEVAVEVATGAVAPEPWVVHVNVGDCVEIELANHLPERTVSLQAGMLAAEPASLGAGVGRNPPSAVAPGEAGRYIYYAHLEVGETVALVTDGADSLLGPRSGLYGAIVVGPAGSRYTDPVTGDDVAAGSGWRADVHPPGAPSYRSFTLFLQDEDAIIGTAVMPYNEHVQGVVGLNYARAANPDPGAGVASVPDTPLLEAHAGDRVQLHVLVPSGEQLHVIGVEGHRWHLEPGRPDTTLVSAQAIGPLEAITLELAGGAGAPAIYRYGDRRAPYREAGLWGLFHVRAPGEGAAELRPLPRSVVER